jgi:hypothetical protein
MGTAEATHRLLRQTTLNLKVISWRLFLHGASREQPDNHVIEVRCCLDQPLLAGHIIVGTLSENLNSLVISIQIGSAQKYFEVASQKMEKNAVGWLRYNPPVSSGDGVVDDKTGSVDGGVFFGNDTMREISRLLTLQPAPDIHIGATVNLDRETSQMYSNRKWDGKELLEIEEAVIVAANAPLVTPEKPPELDESPLLRTIANSVDKLNTNIGRLGIYILIALGLILIELWRQHG